MFKPNDYDLDREYRQRQMVRSELVQQARTVHTDKVLFLTHLRSVVTSVVSRLLSTQDKQPPTHGIHQEFNREVHAT